MTRKFDFRQILPIASIGLVTGIIQLPLMISFAILIFPGELSSFATVGIGMVLFGGLIMHLIIALTSSVPGMIGGPQDSPSAIMGLAALSIAANMQSASAEAKFITVVATVVLTSILSGLLFFGHRRVQTQPSCALHSLSGGRWFCCRDRLAAGTGGLWNIAR